MGTCQSQNNQSKFIEPLHKQTVRHELVNTASPVAGHIELAIMDVDDLIQEIGDPILKAKLLELQINVKEAHRLNREHISSIHDLLRYTWEKPRVS